MQNNNIKLTSLLAQILNIKPSDVSDLTSPENTPSWDSFNALVIITGIETEFNVSLNMDDISSMSNVADIKKILKNNGIEFEDR